MAKTTLTETERKILEASGALYPAPAPLNIKQKLVQIQNELKAPKGRKNTFGGYKYRSCEDIMEAVKPLLRKYAVMLTIRDEVDHVGDRYYIKAIAYLEDTESDGFYSVAAYAREDDQKKGMDAAQVTGASSSYARKYALNGLFLIDDTKDADTDEFQRENAGRMADGNKLPAEPKEPRKGQFCEMCGKPVSDKLAQRSRELYNGHVYCSAKCRDERPIEGGSENA